MPQSLQNSLCYLMTLCIGLSSSFYLKPPALSWLQARLRAFLFALIALGGKVYLDRCRIIAEVNC